MTHLTTPTEQEIDRLGHHVSAQLTLLTPNLPHDISERLRLARHLALAQRKPVLQARKAKRLQINGSSTLTASPEEDFGFWHILGSTLPLLALVAGLMAIQWIQQDHVTSEIAAIDSALLTDELPPDAYTDAGFAQFLKQGLGGSAKHD